MKFDIVVISDSDKHFKQAIDEYCKRLGSCVTIHTIKPHKNGTHTQIIERETSAVLAIIQKKSIPTYLLSISGNNISTEDFVQLTNTHHHIRLIIGGPYGLNEDTLAPYSNGKLGFGHITMPHGLAKLVALEQCYRAIQIIQGKQYHY